MNTMTKSRILLLATASIFILIIIAGCSAIVNANTGKGAAQSNKNKPIPTLDIAPEELKETPTVNTFAFTRENMPKLDGSTSTAPLAEAACSVLLGESREEVADLVQFNKTTTAYYNLMSGYADLLIVGEDNAEILEQKESVGFEWERQPFATDAFIFVVNEDNPVDSITIDEAKRIYTGEITNWSELGGNDQQIIPLQRNSDAGSQNLMEKLVMKGTPMMEAPSSYIMSTMGQLMEVAKSYDGSSGAIGYTVYYYAEEMEMARGLKILAVEGIEPNPATIRSEEYPLLNPKYVGIPADAAEDSPNRILFNWLLGEEGQRLVAHEGYVSIIEVTEP
jgi:phosphate transport system substrate-binding protein